MNLKVPVAVAYSDDFSRKKHPIQKVLTFKHESCSVEHKVELLKESAVECFVTIARSSLVVNWRAFGSDRVAPGDNEF